jgi:magnesium transporter
MVQETLPRDEIVVRLTELSAARRAAYVEREVRQLLDRLSNREVAESLLELEDQELVDLVAQLSNDTIADLLAELDPVEGADLLLRLSRVRAADVLEEMDPDDAADLMLAANQVDERAAADILTEMQPEEAGDLRELLAYPADSAGGIMTTRVVAVNEDITASEALASVRRLAREGRTETVYYLYVTNTERRLVGVLSLRELVLAHPSSTLSAVMRRNFATVRPEADQEAVARLLTEKHLLALPVVDTGGRLLGIVTNDDVEEVLEEEATEDIQHLGGSQPLEVPYTSASVWLLARKRVGWLLLLLVAGAYTGEVLRAFEGELEAAVALTFFIPMLLGTGGNIGSQVVTTVIRAQALGEVGWEDMRSVVWKEWRVAALLAATMGAVSFLRAWLLGVDFDVRLTVVLAIIPIVMWAATIGAVLPLVLRRVRLDPAVVSAPFITTVVDGTGLIIYLEVARFLLDL